MTAPDPALVERALSAWDSVYEGQCEIGSPHWTDNREAAMAAAVEAILAALRESGRLVDGMGNRWQHVKRGTCYTEVSSAELQTSEPLEDGAALVIYRGDDGKWWARPEGEFTDGRFLLIEAPPETAAAEVNDVCCRDAPTAHAEAAEIIKGIQSIADDRQRAVEAERKRIILILQDDAELYERGPGTDLRAAYLRRLIERIDAIRARGAAQEET